mmetsp:Transcript_58789/g.137274  ORF Transcript_58789/g.137274 Transcript_58789/m.137274 type:complete len:226 (-) Transcript_58789:1046-1723(-)
MNSSRASCTSGSVQATAMVAPAASTHAENTFRWTCMPLAATALARGSRTLDACAAKASKWSKVAAAAAPKAEASDATAAPCVLAATSTTSFPTRCKEPTRTGTTFARLGAASSVESSLKMASIAEAAFCTNSISASEAKRSAMAASKSNSPSVVDCAGLSASASSIAPSYADCLTHTAESCKARTSGTAHAGCTSRAPDKEKTTACTAAARSNASLDGEAVRAAS